MRSDTKKFFCRKAGQRDLPPAWRFGAGCYRWRKEYDGLKVNQARRLKRLEQEDARLRCVVSDLTLD